ncbi:MAG: hypothetical protein HY905_15845 [Deltaproteobacteria bacterium]|nr:hypothetical protein [Deltaproteobacteria bacterium]
MRLFSYILRYDDGFAPNPFHGRCTLACCKPVIRRVAQPGDWVVGLTSGGVGVVYAMQVSEKPPFAQYWSDPRFARKHPDRECADPKRRCGDNIYRPLRDGEFEQRPSPHSNDDGTPNEKAMAHDLGGKFVLVGKPFVYFGAHAPPLPPDLEFLKVRRGHRSRFSEEQVERFVAWFGRLRARGMRGKPALWSVTDRGRGCGRCGSS